jgi:hypothetical protein
VKHDYVWDVAPACSRYGRLGVVTDDHQILTFQVEDPEAFIDAIDKRLKH